MTRRTDEMATCACGRSFKPKRFGKGKHSCQSCAHGFQRYQGRVAGPGGSYVDTYSRFARYSQSVRYVIKDWREGEGERKRAEAAARAAVEVLRKDASLAKLREVRQRVADEYGDRYTSWKDAHGVARETPAESREAV